jgi:hypothetical protein
MNKKITILYSLILLCSCVFAQEKKYDLKMYGFIRNDFYHDSYKGLNAGLDNFYIYPLYAGVDESGAEINKTGMTNYTAMATRFGVNITGPEILGAKSSANFETDFSGIVSAYPEVLRLRKAYVKLQWEKASLLLGQTWHPMFNGVGANFPHVANLNTGCPFNPFNRSPQVRFEYHSGYVTLSATALYEQQYCSKGFYTTSNSSTANLAKRNAGIPEMVFGVNFMAEAVTVGIAGQFNVIQPLALTDMNYVTDELNTSLSGMAYASYKKDKLFVLAKGLYGQNMANMLMLGGYGATSYNSTTGEMKYTNYNNYSTFVNLVYGAKVQFGFFAGISGNLGTVDPLCNIDGSAKIAGLGTSIKTLSRISTQLIYNVKNMTLSAEYEMTSADYGTGDFDFYDGLYDDTVNATNHRIALVLTYNF